MILVDTSVWVDHLRAADAILEDLLGNGVVLAHPFVIGELALGHLRQRSRALSDLLELPQAAVASDDEVLHFIGRHELSGRGIGYVDAHLLAAVRLTTGATIWTRDQRLREVAKQLSIAARLATESGPRRLRALPGRRINPGGSRAARAWREWRAVSHRLRHRRHLHRLHPARRRTRAHPPAQMPHHARRSLDRRARRPRRTGARGGRRVRRRGRDRPRHHARHQRPDRAARRPPRPAHHARFSRPPGDGHRAALRHLRPVPALPAAAGAAPTAARRRRTDGPRRARGAAARRGGFA